MGEYWPEKHKSDKLESAKAYKVKDALRQPSIGPCLQFSPPSLQAAYFRTSMGDHLHWDQQVAMVECLRLLVLGLDGCTKLGFQRTLEAFGPGWVVCLLWLAALQSPAAYKQCRVALVTLLRLAMALASAHSSSQLRDQIYAATPFESPQLALLTRLLLFPHIFNAVLEAACCPGLGLQAAAVGFRAACLLAGRGAQELIRFGSSTQYLAAAAALNSSWAAMLQPALPLHVPQHASLAGRSAEMLLALATLHLTTAALLVYATYVSVWAQLRLWLRQRLQEAANSHREAVTVGGVTVRAQQLAAMHSCCPAASLLDPFSSAWDKGTSAALHLMVLGLVCQAALFCSKLLVLQLLPQLLPLTLMDVYYPPCPDGACTSAAAVAAADAAAGPWWSGGSAAAGEASAGSWWLFAC